MLDTHARKYISPVISKIADKLLKFNLTPNQITLAGFLFGILSAVIYYFNYPALAVLILWISGLLDVLDGAMARKANMTSSFGTVMDVTFDRLVEIGIIISIAFLHPSTRFVLILLMGSIIFSMTVFLTVGAVSEKKGVKSFYYQAGLAERTEGFIFFSIMMLFSDIIIITTTIFLILIVITAIQRMFEAKKILD